MLATICSHAADGHMTWSQGTQGIHVREGNPALNLICTESSHAPSGQHKLFADDEGANTKIMVRWKFSWLPKLEIGK